MGTKMSIFDDRRKEEDEQPKTLWLTILYFIVAIIFIGLVEQLQ